MKKFRAQSLITIKTEENAAYDILLRNDFSELSEQLTRIGCGGHRVCIVTDSNVAPLYLNAVKACAEAACEQVSVFEFPAGEAAKTLDTVKQLYEHLIQNGFDRKDCLLALGGGVVGDLTGYAAATYLRGIRFVQVPTTVLAQVDSSIGGKTGVDFDQYKNMVGTFHQPALVYINCSTLKSLPEEQFCNGLGEVVKYGLILDADFYEWLIDHMSDLEDREYDLMSVMISHCCELKKYIVEKDPKETTGERALLNFGHTLGHAIEKLKSFELPHGECVSLGMVAAACISWKRGLIDEDEFYEIRDMNVGFGLPISYDGIAPEAIVEATRKDKKMDAGKIQFVLLKKLGQAFVASDVTEAEMLEAVSVLNADA